MSKVEALKDCCSFQEGYVNPSQKIREYFGGNIKWLRASDLNGLFVYDTEKTLSQKGFESAGTSAFMFKKDTLAISKSGTIGTLGILKDEMCGNRAVINIDVDKTKADLFYIFYLLKYKNRELVSKAHGSIQKNLYISVLEQTKVNHSDLSTQQKIAAVLSALDTKIELNQRINAELEQVAKTLYDYWFVQFEFPTPLPSPLNGGSLSAGTPYKSSGGKMVWNEELKREIPRGWEVKKLADWIESDKSGDWGKDEEEGNYTQKVTCIRGTDINGLNGTDTCNPPSRFILEKNAHKILNSHDLIIEISGGAPKQSTGRLGFVTDAALRRFADPLICSNFCKAIVLKDKKQLYNFVYHWNMLYENDVFFGYEGKTSGIKNLLFDSFVNSHWTVVPPSELVNKFYDFMQEIQAKKQTALLESQTLTELRDWLLPMLMNGQVTV